MTVTDVRKDTDALTMTLDAEFDASPERVWELWADPRQLERWWGPPSYPATFTKHDLAPGSRVEYHMTTPEGDQPKGFWDIVEVDATASARRPRRLRQRRRDAEHGHADRRDARDDREIGGGRTRMSIENRFPSAEAMEQLLAMGQEEGMKQAHRPDRRDPRRGAGREPGAEPMADSPLARLVGTWEFEPLIEGRSKGRGRATFEWIEDGAFLLERSDAAWTDPGWLENAPGTTQAVIGFDDTTDEVVQLYADDRGVFRVYRGTLTDEEWRLQRAAPDFHQRFVGVFGDGGRTIDGRWETSTDGAAWELEFPITYRKIETTDDIDRPAGSHRADGQRQARRNQR